MLALALLALTAAAPEPAAAQEPPEMKKLTPAEERVIVHKGTERPFTGEFVDHKADGTYTCKRCGAPLYRSDTKFDSGCGWPSFDQEIPGTVRRQPDADGRRVEIVCARCGGHLGHVFEGEGFTPRNIRHCVNSISLDFEPAQQSSPALEKAYFAGGCFWGVEYHLEKVDGVISATSGYAGGSASSPSYEQVCSGSTGHAEVVEVVFDPGRTSYEALARLFFEIHDPTQLNRQGPDRGTQYRSAVFTMNKEQERVTKALIADLKRKGYGVVTEVQPLEEFWPAEAYHQDYYERKGSLPYCHSRVKRF